MRVYLKNNRVKLHPDVMLIDAALDFSERRRPQQEQAQEKVE